MTQAQPEFAELFRTEDFQERLRAAKESRAPACQGRSARLRAAWS
jgi:hypothetical protein